MMWAIGILMWLVFNGVVVGVVHGGALRGRAQRAAIVRDGDA